MCWRLSPRWDSSLRLLPGGAWAVTGTADPAGITWAGEGPRYGYNRNLTDEQQKALDQERQAFLNATESLRQDLYAKNLELRSELAKDNPDAQKAAALQKEISKLESELDQKQLDFMLNARKVAPDAGRGYMMGGRGGMMGYGPGYGYGAGPRGGYCWE